MSAEVTTTALFLASLVFMLWWNGRMREMTLTPVKPKDTYLVDRKARFKEYVAGEKQLMADWESAYGPDPVLDFTRSHGFMPERGSAEWSNADEKIYQMWLTKHWPKILEDKRRKELGIPTREEAFATDVRRETQRMKNEYAITGNPYQPQYSSPNLTWNEYLNTVMRGPHA